MNINQIISDFPVGEPNEITFVFGSDFGIKVLSGSEFTNYQDILSEWLKLIWKSSNRMLALLGYCRDVNTNEVIVKVNGRRVTLLDMEHYFCLAAYVLPQRNSGGTRSFSSNPRVSRKHMYPIKGASFFVDNQLSTIAAEAIRCYEDLVNNNKLHLLDSEIEYRKPTDCESFVILMAMVNGWNGGSLDDILENNHNQRMVRDNYRCLATEINSGHCVITIDNNSGELYDQSNKERHFNYNVETITQSRSRVHEKSFIDSVEYMWGKVVEIDLDYCWFQRNYYSFNNNFYANCIPEMSVLLTDDGTINFPLDAAIFVGIIDNKNTIESKYEIKLIGEKQCNNILLFKATEKISEAYIWNRFGKKQGQYKNLLLKKSELKQCYNHNKDAEQTWEIYNKLTHNVSGQPRFIQLRKKRVEIEMGILQ